MLRKKSVCCHYQVLINERFIKGVFYLIRMRRRKSLACSEEDLNKLEDILALEKVTPKTDVDDFLLIAGFNYSYSSCLYRRLEKMFKNKTPQLLHKRIKRKFGPDERNLRTRFFYSVLNWGYEKDFKTLGELKGVIEKKGMSYRGLGYKSLSVFNKALKEYGIEPLYRKV